jgi:hypothetical protein
MSKRWLLILFGLILFILGIFIGFSQIAGMLVVFPLQIIGILLMLLGIMNFFQISTWLKVTIAVIFTPVLCGVFFYLMIMFVPK